MENVFVLFVGGGGQGARGNAVQMERLSQLALQSLVQDTLKLRKYSLVLVDGRNWVEAIRHTMMYWCQQDPA